MMENDKPTTAKRRKPTATGLVPKDLVYADVQAHFGEVGARSC